MTINIENLDKLINHLNNLKNPKTFDMGTWLEFEGERLNDLKLDTAEKVGRRLLREGDCGTVACLAGHARLLADPKERLYYDADYSDDTQTIAGEWLGLDWRQEEALFMPGGFTNNLVTPKIAVRVLENLRKSALAGDEEPLIDWNLAADQLNAEEGTPREKWR